MRKLIVSAAAVALCAAGAARAEDGVGVGKYRWNEKASHYESGVYATEQTMIIYKNTKNELSVMQVVTPVGGKTFSWSIDAPYDDQMRHGSTWMSFAFSRISDNEFHDRYIMDDTGEKGAETFTITPKRLTIRGSSVHNGKEMSYVEVWDRVD
jgi:hypothetical protein